MKIKNYDAYNELKTKILKNNEKRTRMKMLHAKNDYHKKIINGDWSVIVPEWNEDLDWEKWEQDISDFNKMKNKIKGEIFMSKREMTIRLSKDFHNFEIKATEIDPAVENVEDLRNEMVEFAMNSVSMLPGELKSSKVKSPENYAKTAYTPKQPSTYAPSQVEKGKATLNDITTQFIKGKQKTIALGKINSGELSLEALNNSSSWDETQSLVFGK